MKGRNSYQTTRGGLKTAFSLSKYILELWCFTGDIFLHFDGTILPFISLSHALQDV
jgi:hypothetical protein